VSNGAEVRTHDGAVEPRGDDDDDDAKGDYVMTWSEEARLHDEAARPRGDDDDAEKLVRNLDDEEVGSGAKGDNDDAEKLAGNLYEVYVLFYSVLLAPSKEEHLYLLTVELHINL
jgi:hypothetical protein